MNSIINLNGYCLPQKATSHTAIQCNFKAGINQICAHFQVKSGQVKVNFHKKHSARKGLKHGH